MTTQKSIRGSHIGKPRICVRLCACPRELFNIQSTHWSSRPRYVSDEKKSVNSQSAFPTQSSVCILYLVCILHPVCSLQSAFCTDRIGLPTKIKNWAVNFKIAQTLAITIPYWTIYCYVVHLWNGVLFQQKMTILDFGARYWKIWLKN